MLYIVCFWNKSVWYRLTRALGPTLWTMAELAMMTRFQYFLSYIKFGWSFWSRETAEGFTNHTITIKSYNEYDVTWHLHANITVCLGSRGDSNVPTQWNSVCTCLKQYAICSEPLDIGPVEELGYSVTTRQLTYFREAGYAGLVWSTLIAWNQCSKHHAVIPSSSIHVVVSALLHWNVEHICPLQIGRSSHVPPHPNRYLPQMLCNSDSVVRRRLIYGPFLLRMTCRHIYGGPLLTPLN